MEEEHPHVAPPPLGSSDQVWQVRAQSKPTL